MKSSNAKALASNELIGLNAEVINSPDPTLIGLKGKIVDETMKTLTLETGKGDKVLNKQAISLSIGFPEGALEVKGSEIMQRPHERLKKLWRKVK